MKTLVKPKIVVLIKWTCQHCGAIQAFEKLNTIYEEGECYVCGKTTKIPLAQQFKQK